MPKYVVLYAAPVSASAQMESNDPAMAAEVMKAWTDWAEKAGSGLVDLGLPLGNGRKVTATGTADSESDVAGYSILQADNVNDAVKLVKDHPHLQMPGASIEVYESLNLPGA